MVRKASNLLDILFVLIEKRKVDSKSPWTAPNINTICIVAFICSVDVPLRISLKKKDIQRYEIFDMVVPTCPTTSH
jgi:hypothetical protein